MNNHAQQTTVGDLRLLARDSTVTARSVPPPKLHWRTRVLLPGVILLCGAALLAYAARDTLVPATEVRVLPVVLKPMADGGQPPTTAPGASIVQAAGWVEADPYPISVSALTDGVVRDVLVLEGQTIEAGQVVAHLVDDDAKLALAKAEAELRQRQAEFDAATRRWENPVELSRAVAVAEAKLQQANSEQSQVEAEIESESAREEELRAERDRSEGAFRDNAATELEVIQARARHAAQVATVSATRQRRGVLQAQVREAEAELVAAKENLRLRIGDAEALALSESAVALATAARDEAKLRLDRTSVRSPANGVVMQRLVEPGSKVMIGMDDVHSSHIVRLFDPQHLQVRVDIPLADAAKVGVDQPAQVVVGVLPDRTFAGVVTRVVNEADIQKNTLQVKVAIKNPTEQLKPEMLARVKFLGMPASTGTPAVSASGGAMLWASESALHIHGEEAHVWLADTSTNVARRRTVRPTSARQAGWVAVESGLQPGDKLIVGDITKSLRDGERIRVLGEADQGGDHGTH